MPEESAKEDPNVRYSHDQYWKANLKCVGILLSIWFVVSYGCGVLFVDQLDKIPFGGFKLGFWFAQQGSIYVFVVLIAYYVWYMNRLDKHLALANHDHSRFRGIYYIL